MTEEQIKKKANYYEKSLTDDYVENTCIDKLIQQSYIDGYEQCLKDFGTISYTSVKQLKKENEELKTKIDKLENDYNTAGELCNMQALQIEKMKCCGNCKYYRYTGTCMNDDEEVAGDCSCDKWELAK